MRLPALTAVAKAQLWGLAFGFALAFWLTDRMELSLGVFLIGTGLAWVASERVLASRLIGRDLRTISLAIASGIAFPWVGFAAALALASLRP